MLATIDEFKANLVGGGARANQFSITFNTPGAIATGLDIEEHLFLSELDNCQENCNHTRNCSYHLEVELCILLVIESLNNWTTTVLNDTDFMIRNAIERWMNAINDFQTNTGLTNVADYTADLTVEQLDRDDTVLKSYILRNCFPLSTSALT